MKYCSNCGNQNEEHVAFCGHCGTPFQQPEPPSQAAPPPEAPVDSEPPPSEAPVDSEPPSQAAPPQYVQPEAFPPQEPTPQQPPQYVQPDQANAPQYVQPDQAYTPPIEPQLAPAQPIIVKKKSGGGFIQNGLGFVVMGVILLATAALVTLEILTTGILASFWLNIQHTSILNRFFIYATVAIFTVVATRIKGPDLSAPVLMAVAAIIMVLIPGEMGLIITAAVCLLLGLFNGTIISLFNAPSIIVTLITGTLFFAGVSFFASFFTINVLFITWARPGITQLNLSLIAFSVAIILAFGALAITRHLVKQKQKIKRGILSKVMDIAGYGLVALIAGIAGYLSVNLYGSAHPNMGQGYEIYVLIIFAAVQSCRMFSNGMLALVYGVFVAFIYTLLSMALQILVSGYNLLNIIYTSIALILLCTACVAQGGWKSALGANLSD